MVARYLPRRRLFVVIDLFGLALAIAPYVWLLGVYDSLPDRVPTHFGPSEADAWGSKRSIWWVPSIGLAFYLAMTVVGYFPKIWNLPVQLTEQNVERVLSTTAVMMRAITIAMVLSCLYVTLQVARVALGESAGLGAWFLPVVGGGTLGALLVGLWRIHRASKTSTVS